MISISRSWAYWPKLGVLADSLPERASPVEDLYRTLRTDLQNLFGLLNISVQSI